MLVVWFSVLILQLFRFAATKRHIKILLHRQHLQSAKISKTAGLISYYTWGHCRCSCWLELHTTCDAGYTCIMFMEFYSWITTLYDFVSAMRRVAFVWMFSIFILDLQLRLVHCSRWSVSLKAFHIWMCPEPCFLKIELTWIWPKIGPACHMVKKCGGGS